MLLCGTWHRLYKIRRVNKIKKAFNQQLDVTADMNVEISDI